MVQIYSTCGPDFMPTKATEGSVGWDIRTPVDFTLGVGDYGVCVDTGLVLNAEKDFRKIWYAIHIRSSMGVKYGVQLMNGTGIVDNDYNGEDDTLKLFFMRLVAGTSGASDPIVFKAGDRVAQIILHEECEAEVVPGMYSTSKSRGGFGSTGKR